jgi:hypothetical protein
MHRIDHATAIADMHGAGKAGFGGGNPTSSTPATRFTPDWANDLQENVAGPIEAVGMALDKGNGGQLLAAIQAMITEAAFGIPPLPDHVGAAADGDELAVVVGGVHKRISVAELFTGREGVDLYARDGLAEVAWQLAIDKATPMGLFANTGRLNVFATDNLVVKANAAYDAITKTYSNPGTVTTASAAGEWSGAASFAFAGDDVLNASVVDAATRSTQTFNGDFEFTCTLAGAGDRHRIGVYLASQDGAFSTGDGDQNSITGRWHYVRSTGQLQYNGANVAALAAITGDVIKFARVGSAISVSKNGVLVHTFAATSAAPLRTWIGRGNVGGDCGWDNVSWVEPGGALDMTLRDTALVVPAAPVDGRLTFLHKWGSAGVYGTDIKAYMCRDNAAGGIWAEGALTLLHPWAFDQTWNVVAADFDLSGLAAGTQVIPELRTHNLVEQYVRATHYNAA